MAQLVPNRYAFALFELAKDAQAVDSYYEEVCFVKQLCDTQPEFTKMLEHPQVAPDDKVKILEAALKGKISNDLLGLFALVLRKNRETEITGIMESFVKKYKDYKGITEALVTSAVALTDEQQKNLQLKLSQNLNKQVTVITEVDPSLIGGLCVKVDGHVMDGTIKTQLHDMKTLLLNIKLA